MQMRWKILASKSLAKRLTFFHNKTVQSVSFASVIRKGVSNPTYVITNNL